MSPEKWNEISEIFHAALAKEPSERVEFLNKACGENVELRLEIETLLASNDQQDSFIDSPKAGFASQIAKINLKKNEKIGAFQIIELLGVGGMGEVYLAKDLRLNRQVALKFLSLTDENSNRRFLREAQAAASLEHPHICTIHEIDNEDGRDFIVMQYVEGETLSEKIKNQKLSAKDALEIAEQVADALAEAHSHGIIHRDIKPANIIVSGNNQVKVLDFGLAKKVVFDTDESSSSVKTLLSHPGMIIGTASYMSPEQIRGVKLDNRTDLWSLGVVLYEILLGKLPFEGANGVEKLASILYHEPEKPKNLPTKIEELLTKSLQKEPNDRYQTAAEMIAHIQLIRKEMEFAEQLEIHASTSSGDEKIDEQVSRFLSEHPAIEIKTQKRKSTNWLAILFSSVIVSLLIFGGWLLWKNYRQQNALDELSKAEEFAKQEKNFEAYDLAMQVKNVLPDNENLAKLMPAISNTLSVLSDQNGAKVYLRRFQPDKSGKFPERQLIGETPLNEIQVARGNYILQIEKEGFAPFERTISGTIPRIGGSFIETPPLKIEAKLIAADKLPVRMIYVPAGEYSLVNWSRSTESKVNLADYFIDKYEVTNAEFREFVSAGGYKKKELWKYPFIKDKKTISLDEALTYFKDKTGLNAPRNWTSQSFPEGKDNFPVTDITWYEAAAYAEFRGEKLPTVFQWEKAARDGMFDPRYNAMPWGVIKQGETTDNQANFRGSGTVAATDNEFGMSPFGAFNMAGNVSEWNLNESSEGFVTSGGAWNDLVYSFGDYGIYPGFYSANRIGFRCALNSPDSTNDQGSQNIPAAEIPDYKTTSDAAFKNLLTHYEYDKKTLNAQVVETIESSDWRREKINFTGESGEQVIAYLYLPRNFVRPLQVIHFVPPGDVVRGIRSLPDSVEMFLTPLIKSGRAVFAVVLKGYIERPFPQNYVLPDNSTIEFRKQMVNWITDLRRGLDYLETREDLNKNKTAFLGISNGANLGLILTAIETRYKTLIFESAGLEKDFRTRLPETSPINFASQVHTQKLFINGLYDETFPFKTDAKPLFKLLREPKKTVQYEGGHIPTIEFFAPLANNWLNETLGSVSE